MRVLSGVCDSADGERAEERLMRGGTGSCTVHVESRLLKMLTTAVTTGWENVQLPDTGAGEIWQLVVWSDGGHVAIA